MEGRHVAVLRKGSGSQILFLHGYMSCKESFYSQINFFSAHGFECIAPDLPGFGQSAPLLAEWSVGDYAVWLNNFFNAARLNSPHIIAHSFGARVAFKFLSANNRASKLVITGGAGLVKKRSLRYILRVKAYRAVKKFAPRFAEKHFGSREFRLLSPTMRGSYKKIVNEDLRGCAALIKNKTLLIYGSGDAVTPAEEEGRTFKSLIPQSRLLIIGGDHFCFCSNARVFNGAVLAFLNGG